ncbi:MAG: glycosyltransferase family 8 protein [Candidatus Paceibacterota bacterium]|jgi:lipopolysaccharide biosynthesis glycosyltransferase
MKNITKDTKVSSEKIKQIDVIFSSDNNYAKHLGVTLCSIFANKSKEYSISIHVIDGGISNKNKNKLKNLEKRYLFNINYINIKSNEYEDLFTSDHITKATYYRISIPNLLNNKIKKILYLDCDLIVLGDLLELFEKSVDNYFIGAVEEKVSDTKKDLGIDEKKPYFNAGVMLMNLNKWREANISEKTLSFARKNPEKIKLWDQDSLNAILVDKWLILDNRYNFLTSEIERTLFKKTIGGPGPLVVHYSSSIKPWKFNGKHPYNDEYFYYLKKTGWNRIFIYTPKMRSVIIKTIKLKRSLIKLIKKPIKKILKK